MTRTSNVNRPLVDVLIDVFDHGHGDQSSVAARLGISRQKVNSWLTGEPVDPFTRVVAITQQLRENGNESADLPIFTVCRALNIVAYRRDSVPESSDACLADVVREMSDVLRTHAEADADGWITEEERRSLMTQLDELAERAHAMRDAIAARRVLTVAAMRVRR